MLERVNRVSNDENQDSRVCVWCNSSDNDCVFCNDSSAPLDFVSESE